MPSAPLPRTTDASPSGWRGVRPTWWRLWKERYCGSGRTNRTRETDPAYGIRSASRRQFDEATCAGLVDRRTDVAADGSVLQPLVAAAMPDVSEDGRTYTFTVRDGFAFSPPSNEPLTAETYRRSIERAIRMTGTDLFDVEGLFDLAEGDAERVSGVSAEQNRLTIGASRPTR